LTDINDASHHQISMIQQVADQLRECDDPAAIFAVVNSDCPPAQELGLARLTKLIALRDCSLDLQSVLLKPEENTGVINAMATLDPKVWSTGCDRVALLKTALRCRATPTQAAVARLICRKMPSHLSLLLESLNMPIARILCFHAARGELSDAAVVCLVRFMAASCGENSLPPVLGLAISPRWLAAFNDDDPVLGGRLAKAFGGIEPKLPSFPREHLNEGICFINGQLANSPIAGIRDDLQAISRHLLSLGGTLSPQFPTVLHDGRSIDSMDLHNPMDQGLLFAAVREYERDDLAARPLPSPFCFNGLRDETSDAVQFLHLPVNLMRERLIGDPLNLAHSLSVPPSLQSRFVFEYSLTQLQPGENQRIESVLFLNARWAAMRDADCWVPDKFQPVMTQNLNLRLPEAVLTVLPDRNIPVAGSQEHSLRLPATPSEDVISPCASACLRLMAILKHPELQDARKELQENERFWSDRLLPLGIEIQIPHVCDTKHVGWKELFRSTGIPSPRRPECGRMLELALPPSVSWHAPSRILQLVSELGVPAGAQDLAIHVSLQGDLEQIAGYLAFTQLFMNTSSVRSPRPIAALRHVMSKGFVHLNRDVIQCRWSETATCRTELRVVIARVMRRDDRLRIDAEALECVSQFQLIASASRSSAWECRALALSFVESLRAVVQDSPPCLLQLMEANFCESTGDHRAVDFLNSLQILRLREETRTMSDDQKAAFRQSVRQLRADYAARIESILRRDSQG